MARHSLPAGRLSLGYRRRRRRGRAGGDPIGDDLGYGAPCLVEPDRVRAIAADLRAVDVRAFRARYDPAALTAADIYPGVWDEPDVLDTYLVPHFVALRTFYLTAADEGDAVLLAMT